MQIDLLKAIGLLLIILAHVKPGFFLMQLRIFDVPLMVLISGYLAQDSYIRSKTPLHYYTKRLIRLYFPTVSFLTFFFLFFYLTLTPFPFSLSSILRSYGLLFSNTIGYVWIIRVFLLCALLVPMLVQFQKYIISKMGAVSLIALYIIYEYILRKVPYSSEFFREIILYAIGYGIVLVFGMLLHNLSQKNICIISAILGTIYCIIVIYLYNQTGHYTSMQQYKYPPQLYYLSYSVAVSYFLFAITQKIQLKKTYHIVHFLSRYSLSICLWHIFFLYLLKFNKITAPWYITYIEIVLISCLTSYFINKLILDCHKLKTIKFLSRKPQTHSGQSSKVA